jgi:arabinose-5-phosphate isomerase
MIETARRVFSIEIDSLRHVAERLDGRFEEAVRAILATRGKVIVTGLGKSGAVGRKIAATFSSTGAPAIYLHPTEGVHGDLGVIARDDLVIAISYSGETEELSRLLPAIRRLGVILIAITGAPHSTLGQSASIVIDAGIPQEACPLGLAPTSSTTATLVLGDALAIAVLEARGFTAEDFAFRHPGGSLGRSLLRVSDLMHTGENLPLSRASDAMRAAIVEMSRKKLGMTAILDETGRLVGIFTDGDLRRTVQEARGEILDRPVADFMTRAPRTIDRDRLAVQALTLMEERKITSLVVADAEGRPEGVIHIHDILRSKVV